MKRQVNLSDQELRELQARQEAEMARDDEIMFQPEDSVKIPSRPIYNFYRDDPKNGETLAGAGATEEQDQDTNADAEKRVDMAPQKTDESKVNASQLNYEHQNNENDINVQNTASITVTFTFPSKS